MPSQQMELSAGRHSGSLVQVGARVCGQGVQPAASKCLPGLSSSLKGSVIDFKMSGIVSKSNMQEGLRIATNGLTEM